jgi:hypothetical protein
MIVKNRTEKEISLFHGGEDLRARAENVLQYAIERLC